MKDKKQDKQRGSKAPSETKTQPGIPQDPNQREQVREEGTIRKVNREAYGDNYEVHQEDEISREEADTENENRAGK